MAGLLQRKSHIAPPRAGGWNEASQEVAGTFRIPVAGVTAGNQLVDEQADQTTESAAGRAVVIIPKGLDLGKKVDTLLFFHGMFNAGDRERTTADKHRGKAGTVHDVEVDRIPQQIASNGGNVVAVLPQGTNLARFGIADPDAYVKEVLKLATPEYQKQPQAQQLAGPIEPGKVIVSGHSGGGRAAFAAVQKLESKGSVNAWLASPPLMLFDAINGTAELDAVASWVEGWLDTDLAMLSAVTPPKTPADLLKQRRLKLLSTFTAGSRYEALNAKGSYVDDKGATITITTAQGLRGRIEKWFTTHHVDPAYATELRAQYVVDGPVGGVHEQTVGTGSSPEMEGKPRVAAPGGLTGASKAAGVPGYSGGGRLEKGLAKLYPKRAALARAPGDDTAQLEADWNDPA